MSETLGCEDLPASIFRTLPTNGRFSTLFLNPHGKISTAVSRDYACLMSLNKDETGCRLSRMLLLLVVWWSSLLKIVTYKTFGRIYLNQNDLSFSIFTSFTNLIITISIHTTTMKIKIKQTNRFSNYTNVDIVINNLNSSCY